MSVERLKKMICLLIPLLILATTVHTQPNNFPVPSSRHQKPKSLLLLNPGIKIHKQLVSLDSETPNPISEIPEPPSDPLGKKVLLGGGIGCVGAAAGGLIGAGIGTIFPFEESSIVSARLAYTGIGAGVGYVFGSALGVWKAGDSEGQDGSFGDTLLAAGLAAVPGIYLSYQIGNPAPFFICPIIGGVLGYNVSASHRARHK